MGEVRRFPESLGPLASQTGGSEAHPLGRSDGRWHIFSGKKGGLCVGKTKRGKGTKIMVLVDGRGLPLSVDVVNASPNEVALIEPLLEKRVIRRRLPRLLYDRAADSDPLRARLDRRGTQLICPHRKNRIKPPTQDGRALRRYKRRWTVERSISWLFGFRRLVVRYEYHAHLFLGFVQLACVLTLLKKF
jgi:transposase